MSWSWFLIRTTVTEIYPNKTKAYPINYNHKEIETLKNIKTQMSNSFCF